MTSGHLRNQIYGREGWEKKLGDGEPGAGADALGGSGGRSLGLPASRSADPRAGGGRAERPLQRAFR